MLEETDWACSIAKVSYEIPRLSNNRSRPAIGSTFCGKDLADSVGELIKWWSVICNSQNLLSRAHVADLIPLEDRHSVVAFILLSKRSVESNKLPALFFFAIVRAHIGAKFRPWPDGLFSLRSSGYQRSRHLARSEFCASRMAPVTIQRLRPSSWRARRVQGRRA